MESGKRGKHTAVRMLREAKLKVTARNLANLNENGIYCQTPHLDADLSRLPRALKTYWADNNLDGGVYPPSTVLYLGSRVQLWADGTHRNIGWLYAHPNHQNRARCTCSPGAASLPTPTVITVGDLAGIQQWTNPVITGCDHCWR